MRSSSLECGLEGHAYEGTIKLPCSDQQDEIYQVFDAGVESRDLRNKVIVETHPIYAGAPVRISGIEQEAVLEKRGMVPTLP